MSEKTIYEKSCYGCMACRCISAGKGCIDMILGEDGFLWAKKNDKCTECGLCSRKCIERTERMEQEEQKPLRCYWAKIKDSKIMYDSSSGGAFGGLASWILKRGGIVYGAAYDKENKVVRHMSTEECSLQRLQKSKYTESLLQDVFFDVEKKLTGGREVLFAGTPCQVAGLKRYLHKGYDNLLCLDFVCHGVPSAQQFHAYVIWQEKRSGKIIENIDFRSKAGGYPNSLMEIEFEDHSIMRQKSVLNPFYASFLENRLLRETCYTCQFVNYHAADLTLADFWGFRSYDPTLNDDKRGISLILCQSPRGVAAFEQVEDQFQCAQLEWEYASYTYRRNEKEYDLAKRGQNLRELKARGFMGMMKKDRRRFLIKAIRAKLSV